MKKNKVLVIDDEPRIRSILSALLQENGYQVQTADSGQSGLELYWQFLPAVVLLDLRMPGMDGIEVMEEIGKKSRVDTKFVIVTAHGAVRSAVEAMKRGAFDYLEKPFDNDELLAVVSRAVEMLTLRNRVRQLEDQLNEAYSFDTIVGVSGKMKSTFALMRKFATADGAVLVSGESGTGKELVIRAIHQASKRKHGPFVVVNCGALPGSLIESEFFGHEAGSFTDAKQLRIGKFEAADGGTLFLDEIAELSPKAQVKLLRVIEERAFCRLGNNDPISVDVRVMAATNRDLPALVREERFREELYWRLNVLSLELSPLRERKEDIPPLVDHFLDKYALALGVVNARVSAEAIGLLTDYDWPGNVRELQNCIYSALAIAESSSIRPGDLPPRIRAGCQEKSAPRVWPVARTSLAEVAADAAGKAEEEAIRKALSEAGGNRAKAAELLGIGRKTLYRKLQQYAIP